MRQVDGAKDVMVTYLKLKVEQEDWHGVRDAAAELEALEKLENFKASQVDPKSGT